MKIKSFTLFIVFILVLLFGLTACSNTEPKDNKKAKTAEEIVIALKGKEVDIGKYVTYTEETDINNLLGRPNQYTSKTTFEIVGLEQVNSTLDSEYFSEEERNEPTGGTIEVFSTEEDMKKRKEYVESVTSSMSALAEYSYSKGCALLRLNHQITPSKAKEYEEAFYSILEN